LLNRRIGIAGRLGQRQLVAICIAHQAEVLGQGDQLGALLRGLLQPVAGARQIDREIGAGDHLNGGKLHLLSPQGALAAEAAGAVSNKSL
jgi:hypothetical protein